MSDCHTDQCDMYAGCTCGLAERLDRIIELLLAPLKEEVASKICLCGHAKSDHIYTTGACRPGFVCESKCEGFVPK